MFLFDITNKYSIFTIVKPNKNVDRTRMICINIFYVRIPRRNTFAKSIKMTIITLLYL